MNRRAVSSFVSRSARSFAPGATVLDAGAGEGGYRSAFRRQRYVAVDLAIGDPDWDYSGVDLVADLSAIPLSDGTVDHVVSTQTLEHLSDPAAFLVEAHRVLRPGGTIHLTAPQSFRLHQEPHDYFRFTRYGLEHLLARAGFSEIRIEPQGGYLWFLADAIQPLHRRLFGKERSLSWRVVTAPLALVSKLVLTALLPLVLYHLDFLDTKRTMTTGHEAVARKPPDGGAA